MLESNIHPHNADCYIVLSGAFKTAVNESMKTENVKLIDNFFPYLFSQIEIQKHGYTIDKIDFPGITSTALRSCFCSPNDEKMLEKTGWKGVIKPVEKECEIIFPLKHLFGFFNDYKEIMWKGGLTIIFRRISNDNEAFYKFATGVALATNTIPPDSKIVIKTMEIRIPVVEYETNHATLLKSNIVKKPIIPISFLNSQTIEKKILWKH